jgi:hypothetical protein
MKPRINAALRKRLTLLEKGKGAKRPIALWPRIMGLDEWEAMAVPMQERLLKENLPYSSGEAKPVITSQLMS